ncbi:hypothetical protein [Acidipropionibacterium virtanenii]|uniref:Uncharacterized protein n=1 Tax=Acidipropionibacterium virtanenii TaxID=2057246 RepID=A0A344UPW8_9ACTN|nr:hypothetical protein [Acidipropionibacterium virtanenii]AXE37316.1 hypothetical protein JS278_00119 [Acidipropionibacterium virtanenii]
MDLLRRHKFLTALAAITLGAMVGGRIGAHRSHQRAELWAVATEGVRSADPRPRWF